MDVPIFHEFGLVDRLTKLPDENHFVVVGALPDWTQGKTTLEKGGKDAIFRSILERHNFKNGSLKGRRSLC